MRSLRLNHVLRQAVALSVAMLIILTSLPLRPTGTALAFKPTDYFKATPNDITHQSITEQAIKDLIEKENFIPGVNKITPSMQKAINAIKEGNSDTDLSSDFLTDEAHFTGETFNGSRSRLIENRNNMIANVRGVGMRRNNPGAARAYLGAATHAIQDFYAHSNWVEMGNSSPYGNLGRAELGTGFDPNSVAGKNEATCNNCDKCRNCDNNVIRAKLTTAYYGTYPWSTKPNGKCSHGAKARVISVPNPTGIGPAAFTKVIHPDMTEDSPAKGGISKDSLSCEDAPHAAQHRDAARVALAATKAYLTYVFKEASLKPTPREQKIIFGVNDTLAFAVDTTGSMGSAIAGVRQRLTEIVNARRGTDLEPSKYVLAPFNDPGVGPLTETDDPDAFIGAINGLYASGGDDCPELAQSGVLQALSAMDDGGELMLVTDASAKDDALAANARAIASAKSVKLTTAALGSCSPIDPEYFRNASETGGQVFVLSPSETGNITKLVDYTVRPDIVELLSISDTLTGTAKTYTLPVDSKTKRITFSVSGTRNLTLQRPDGSTVQLTDAGVDNVPLSNGALVSVANPTSGAWKMTLSGTGELSVRVTGESLLNFSSFNFVDFVANTGHEGYARITGSPVAGRQSTVTAELSAEDVQTARFELRASDGTIIQILNLEEIPTPDMPEFSSALTRKFSGIVTIPNRQFLVYAIGTDANGQLFQRLLHGVIKPRTINLVAQPLGELHPGQITSFSFQVQNFGSAGVFQVSATDDQGYIKTVSAKTVVLGTNQTKAVTLQLQPPVNATVGIVDTLTLTARNSKNPDASNSAVVKTKVAPLSPVQLGTVTTMGDAGASFVESGKSGSLSIQLVNNGDANATNISAMLTSFTPGVEITAGISAYPQLAPSNSATNSAPFTIKLSSDVPCGQNLNFMLLVRHDGSDGPTLYNFSVPTGPSNGTTEASPTTISYAGDPVAIPHDPSGASVPLQVSGLSSSINDLKLRLDRLDYPYVGPLEVTLTSPQGTTVKVIDGAWNGGSNFLNTVLDDDSDGPLISAINWWGAPYTGSYKPVNMLAAFQGENPNGTWILHVRDPYYYYYYTGSVSGFSLFISTAQPGPCDGVITPPSQEADLSVRHIAAPEPVLSGSNITYTTTVTNNGPISANAVQLTNNLPAAVTFVSCAASDGGVCGGLNNNRKITFGSLPAGTTATITIVATVNCEIAHDSVFTDTATVNAATPDPNSTNNSSMAMTRVSNPPPVITNVSVSQPVLWPPNHQLEDVAVNYDVTDNCGLLTTSLSITSNEPVNGTGDGDTSPDWEVVDAHHIRLRAERAGNGNGRIYTVTITSTDSAGGSSRQTVTVLVPKSRR